MALIHTTRVMAAAAFLLGGLAAVPASAQQLHSSFGEWRVLTVSQNGKQSCYIASEPTKEGGNFNNREEPYVLVTHRSAKTDEVSISAGYPYKEGSEVKADIDGKTYKMFTKDKLAWAYNEDQDTTMVNAMKRGSRFSVNGTSQKGTTSTDSYSLSGFTKAYMKMKELCK